MPSLCDGTTYRPRDEVNFRNSLAFRKIINSKDNIEVMIWILHVTCLFGFNLLYKTRPDFEITLIGHFLRLYLSIYIYSI